VASQFVLRGREVSCFALQYVFLELEKRSQPLELFTRDLRYPLEHLRNPAERVDWETFCRFAERIERHWGLDEIFELGARAHMSPLVRWMTVVARALFTPVEYYRFALREFSRKFACIDSSLREVEPGFFRCYLYMRDGYEPHPPLFRALQGGLTTMPTLLGLARGDVHCELLPNGAIFDVRVERRGGRFAWLRRIVTRPFELRFAARELRDANAALHERYCELIRKDAELAETTRDLQALMEQASDAIVISDRALAITEVNARACEWFGRSREELLSMCASDLLEPGHARAVADLLVGTEPREPLETTLKRSDGDPLHVEISSTLLEDGRLLWIVRDISIRKRVEEDRRRHQEELELRLERQARDLERAHAESRALERRVAAAEKLRAAEDLAASLAHAINNPLAALIGTLQMARELQGPDLESSDARTTQRALRIASRVERIVAQTLQLFQQGSVDRAPECPRSILLDVREELFKRAEDQGVQVAIDAPDQLPPIEVNRALITAALVAIAENGLEAMPTGGRLELCAVALGALPVVRLAVIDQGCGIPEAVRSRVLEPFFTTKGGGTGLGLAIASDIVHGHGGRMTIEDHPSGGTVVELELRVSGARLARP